jgi:ribosomal protein S18 acetylase RimI-like enzyme
MQVYPTLPDQLDEIARCHMACFPGSFGTKLGYHYARRSLEWFLAGDNRFLFHVCLNEKIIGYCGGFQSTGIGDGSTSGMMQYAMKEAVKGVLKKPYLIFHPDIVGAYPLIFKNIFRKVFKTKKKIAMPAHVNNMQPKIGLVVIGVDPLYRGQGCFELLMQYFEAESHKRNIQKITLSVKPANARAIAAYSKTGWQIASQTNKAIDMFKIIAADA